MRVTAILGAVCLADSPALLLAYARIERPTVGCLKFGVEIIGVREEDILLGSERFLVDFDFVEHTCEACGNGRLCVPPLGIDPSSMG